MARKGIKAAAARYVARHPGGWAEAALHWLRRLPHEPDFLVFDHIADLPGLVLDVGANRGQSAISVLRRTRRLRVLSLEPNPAQRPALLALTVLHPARFRFRMVAAGERDETLTLLVPRGGVGEVSTEASLAPSEFDRALVRERLAARGVDTRSTSAFRRRRVPVIAVDTLGLAPDVIKLDVEGFEREALLGMRETLARYRPALLIELNAGEKWVPLLRRSGYRFFRYDAAAGRVAPLDPPQGVLNLLALQPGSPSPVSAALWRLAEPADRA